MRQPKLFRCPECGTERNEPLAKSVSHNCKKAKKVVLFKEISNADQHPDQ